MQVSDGQRVRVNFKGGSTAEGEVLTTGAYGFESMAWVSLGGQREVCVPIADLEDVDEVCECTTCSMGYPCAAAHRRFMGSAA